MALKNGVAKGKGGGIWMVNVYPSPVTIDTELFPKPAS